MKKIFLLLFSSYLLLLCTACEKQTGIVSLDVTCDYAYFNVTYTNEYGNDVTEVVDKSTSWSKDFQGRVGDAILLNVDVGPPQWWDDPEVYSTLDISFKGNSLISYEGITEYETIICRGRT